MSIWYSLGASGLLFVASVVLLVIRPRFFAIPWMGMAVVIAGTALSFSMSAFLVTGGRDGVGIGPLFAMMIGFSGLLVTVASVQRRRLPFVPLGAIVTGVIYLSSFYAYILPHLNPDFLGNLFFALPGILLVAYGGYLWHRNGLAESMEHRSLPLRLGIAFVLVAGMGALGLLQFERPGPPGSNDPLLAHPPNLTRIAEESALVVEGVIMDKGSFKYKSSKSGRTIRYQLYEMHVTPFWRGAGSETVLFAVRDYSPVEMTVGSPYLIFASGITNEEQLPNHWSAKFPTHVWTVNESQFYPYPGLPRDAPITRDYVAKLLESQPYIGE
ncbi:MAG: hypothetical protein OXI16_02400 [Chloroflexota bacterium]|nr:hypothetical protein [Chloroflexota bacterium]